MKKHKINKSLLTGKKKKLAPTIESIQSIPQWHITKTAQHRAKDRLVYRFLRIFADYRKDVKDHLVYPFPDRVLFTDEGFHLLIVLEFFFDQVKHQFNHEDVNQWDYLHVGFWFQYNIRAILYRLPLRTDYPNKNLLDNRCQQWLHVVQDYMSYYLWQQYSIKQPELPVDTRLSKLMEAFEAYDLDV